MNASRKRQKVVSACQRCRQRKLGCDETRPCQLCVRAGAECIPRHGDGEDVTSRSATQTSPPVPSIEDEARLREESAVLEESSIIDLSTLIISRMSSERELGEDTSALPGGNKITHPDTTRRHWKQIIGIEMPENDILEELAEEFFDTVDWFMMVFHKPTFKRRFSQLLQSESVAYHEQNFLWLSVLVISLGAHYSSLASTPRFPGLNLKQLSVDLMAQVELRFLQLIGCATLEAVQICVLLGSYFLFNSRPNVGLGISGSGVKIAQVISLHRESTWRDKSAAVRETKRRTWWALEVFDKYAAIAFGRPCTINDSDCSVGMIADLPAPGLEQTEANPLLLCHEWKFRLYRIMGPFLGRRRHANEFRNIEAIHNQLVRWKEQLPSQLQIETLSDATRQPSTLQMQALALQLTYDNLQIILHRTAAFGSNNKLQTNPKASFSVKHLLEAAIRTSNLFKYSHILQTCRRTHANMHIGITLFTAGVVLCAISLSQPLSSTSQRAKNGVMHIIRVCKDTTFGQNLVSRQSILLLERLVAIVLQLENQIITGRAPAPGYEQDSGRTQAPSVAENTIQDQIDVNSISSPDNAAFNSSGVLNPLQAIFATHMPRSSHPVNAFASGEQLPAAEVAPAPEPIDPLPASGFDWSGDLSLLVDSGLGDASQLWLWADNMNYDSFTESSEAGN